MLMQIKSQVVLRLLVLEGEARLQGPTAKGQFRVHSRFWDQVVSFFHEVNGRRPGNPVSAADATEIGEMLTFMMAHASDVLGLHRWGDDGSATRQFVSFLSAGGFVVVP